MTDIQELIAWLQSLAPYSTAERDLRHNEIAALLSACLPFLKEGETPAECIARNRNDWTQATKLLAKELAENERLREILAQRENEIDDLNLAATISPAETRKP